MAPFELIDGFRCYAPEVARGGDGYPTEGFALSVEIEKRSFWVRTRNRILRRVFLRFTDRNRSLDVLEIGCGIGTVIGELRKIPNLRLTGSEVYLPGLRFARERLPGVEFIQLDATRIPFDREYDVIGAFDVLEHIDADETVLRQAFSALRPGGVFIATVPQHPWMWSGLDEIVHHKRRYSRRELRDKLRRAGFDVAYATSFVTALFPLMAVARLRSRARQKPAADSGERFAAEVALPRPLNALFDAVMRVDEAVLLSGLTLPFGGSLLVVARRPGV